MPQDNTQEYHRRICRAIDFINQNLASNPSVAEIAKAAPFSKFHFQRLFKALTGESVAEFTRRIRLETAARRLRFRPHDDITTLAFDLGFSSSQNFAKVFKKHFGVSASEYREHHFGAISSDSTELVLFDSNLQLNVRIEQIEPFRVVYRRVFGSYDDPEVNMAFQEVVRWAKPRGLDVFERYLGIPWDDADVTAEDKCRFDACLHVNQDARLDGGINWQTIPAGKYAVYESEITEHDFDRPWTELMRAWLPSSGFQPDDRPRFERYHTDGSDDPRGQWKLAIWLPVVPI
ncbi:MAG: AraC family transcriptional regulator [Pirellulaceae bacterium]